MLLVAVGCGDDGATSTIPPSTSTTVTSIDIGAVTDDMPVIDGSTSTEPMRALLYCGIVGLECEWADRWLTAEHATVEPTDIDWDLMHWDDNGLSHRSMRSEDPVVDAFFTRVPTSGTHGSYETLSAGDSDLIIVARAPTSEETASAGAAGVTFDLAPVALDAFVFIVNEENPTGTLSLDQIRGIYSGAITEWPVQSGAEGPIQPYQRNETSGSQQLMLQLVMEDLPMVEAPDMLMLGGMGAPFNMLSWDEEGISYSVYYYTVYMQPREYVKMIAIDGIAPTSETIRNGTYPLVTEVFAVIRSDEKGSARTMFEWLQTEEGQEAIADTGYVPLP